VRCLNAIEAVFSDCLSLYRAVSSIGDNICLVRESLVTSYTRSGGSYDVIVARVGSLGRGCGKSSPSVAEQASAIEICNFGHISTVAILIDCSIS